MLYKFYSLTAFIKSAYTDCWNKDCCWWGQNFHTPNISQVLLSRARRFLTQLFSSKFYFGCCLYFTLQKETFYFLILGSKLFFPWCKETDMCSFCSITVCSCLLFFLNKSHTCLLRNPGQFFFGESLKLPEIWWSPGMDLDVLGGCPVLLMTEVFFQNLHISFLHDLH